MTDRTTRTSITLPTGTFELLQRTGNASQYIATAIEERWRDWQAALDTLRSAGWEVAEIKAACDALNGYLFLGSERPGLAIAVELTDAQRLNGICQKWSLDPRQWSRRVKQVSEIEPIARALVVTVRECWSHNAAWDQAVERMR